MRIQEAPQLIATDKMPLGWRPGWFDVAGVALFAPPKTGFSTLKTHFGQHLRAHAIPETCCILGCVRDPVTRWLSAFNHLVLWGDKREDPSAYLVQEHFGDAFFQQWFPPPENITDPVGFCRAWLLEAQPEFERWGCELHLASQTQCYNHLLGEHWAEDPRLQLFDHGQWIPVIWKTTGVMVNLVSNIGVYRHPRHFFNSVHSLIQQTFAEDQRLWQRVGLNTV